MSADNLVVGVGRVLTEAGRDGVRIAGGDRRAGGGAEKSGIAFVVAVLMAELDAGEQRMCEAAGGKPGGQGGLVDSIEALVVVVVGRQRDGGDGERDCFKGFLLLRPHRDFQLVFSNMAGYPGNSGWLVWFRCAIWSGSNCPCWSGAAVTLRRRVRSALRAAPPAGRRGVTGGVRRSLFARWWRRLDCGFPGASKSVCGYSLNIHYSGSFN